MEKQGEVNQPPPPYTETLGNPPQPQQPMNPPPQQPGYPPQQGYPPQGQPGYPPQGQPGYPPQGQTGYPPQGQPGYPPQGYQPYQPPAPQVIAPVQQVSTNVTVVQAGAPTVVARVAPSDHCCLAWFACLCCFWPLGICAIINASNTRDAIDRGDYDSALHSSMMARKYANWSIGVGILIIIVIIIVSVVR